MNDTATLIKFIDGTGSDQEYEAVRYLRSAVDDLPSLFLEQYKKSKSAGQRASFVYHSMKYARDKEPAFNLGVIALSDRSKKVKYRACMLLSYSLNKNALPELEKLRVLETDIRCLADIEATIDSIRSGNSNFFVDRSHTGQIILKIPSV